MKNYFSGNHSFSLCESKTLAQCTLMIDDSPASLSMVRKSLGVSTDEINRFLKLSIDSPSEILLIPDKHVVVEMRLVCLLGYSEAKKREEEERKRATHTFGRVTRKQLVLEELI